MATIGSIKLAIKTYLQVNFPTGNQSPIGGSGFAAVSEAAADQLILLALNNARKYGELKHDWRSSEVRVRATIPAGGRVSWRSLVDFWDEEVTRSMKGLTRAYVESSEAGRLIPIRFETSKGAATLMRERDDAQPMYDEERRYRGDNEYPPGQNHVVVVAHGDYLYLMKDNDEEYNIILDGFAWGDEYEDEADTDFFVERGTAFLMFSAMCEANLLFKQFIVRQEGTIAPPIKERDEQLQVLIDNDNWCVDAAVEHDLK